MSSDENGLRQSPWSNPPVPTHSAESGDQGIGGDLTPQAGASGDIQHPWASPPAPTPSNTTESGPFGNPSRFSSVDGSTQKDTTHQGDITLPPHRTIDKR